MTTIEQLKQQIAELRRPVLVETNEGTFGATEAHRACGSGDPMFATYRVWEKIDGTRYRTGLRSDFQAPGYARSIPHDTAAARRGRVARLEIELRAAEQAAKAAATQRERLARGWDGYQFVGVVAGQSKLATLGT